MARCNASLYAVTVRLPAKLKGVVDLKDHKGADARAVLDLIVSSGCSMQAKELDEDEAGTEMEAVWDGTCFTFYNFLANTSEVGERLSVPLTDIVKALDRKVLTGLTSPNGHYRLVLKDEKHDDCDPATLKEAVSVRMPKKYPGRGLKKMLDASMLDGSIPPTFGVREVKDALLAKNWRVGVHYSDSSIPSAITELTEEGKVVLQRDGMWKDRVWSVTARQAAAAVAPPAPKPQASQISKFEQKARELAEKLMARAEEIAAEMMGF